MGQPRPLFVYFKYYKTQILQKKTEGFSRIRTRIVRVEGDHADHLTTTAAQGGSILSWSGPRTRKY